MKSKKKIIDLSHIIPYFEFTFPFDIDFSLNKDSWHAKKGQTWKLTYNQYEVLNHSEFGEELFGHNN